jgi:DNA-binding transcriptional LysR family regulator
LAQFNNAHPDTHVSLAVTNSPRIAEIVSMLQVDAGVMTSPAVYSGLAFEFRLSLHCVCALSPSHRLANHREIRAKDLQRETLISLDPSFATARRVREIFERAAWGPRVISETSFSYSACEMVRSGAGVAIVDPVTALAFGTRGVVFRSFTPRVDFALGLVRPAYQQQSLACRRLVDILVPALERLPARVDSMLSAS